LTARGWREHLGLADAPLLTPAQAGERLAELAHQHDFAMFEYWLSDVAGHHQDMEEACTLLETFDSMLGGLLRSWDDGPSASDGLILFTSDHGNLEDLSTRRHTFNPVPLLLVGAPALRQQFIARMRTARPARDGLDLTSVAPAILHLLNGE
jgi:bisphosphoglycerate-independent phosphoglycerate mutase (AlkP superfamily)